jgi:hypothetical protein
MTMVEFAHLISQEKIINFTMFPIMMENAGVSKSSQRIKLSLLVEMITNFMSLAMKRRLG